MIQKIKDILSALLLLFVYHKGKEAERLHNIEEELDAIDAKDAIHNSVDTDPEYRSRVQDHFRR